MIRLNDHPAENLLSVYAEGTISQADYEQFKPALEAKTAHYPQVNLLVEIGHLDFVTLAALWEEIKVDVKHWTDFGRLAIVSDDSKLLTGIAALAGTLTPAEVQHFGPEQRAEAEQWAKAGKLPA